MKALNWMYFLFVCLQVDGSIIGEEGGGGGYKLGACLYDFEWGCYRGHGKQMANWLNW